MKLPASISQTDLDPALLAWIQAQHSQRDAALAELKNAQLKIQALTLELAYHKRLKFGVKSEAFSPEQRELFEQSYLEDGVALEAEVEQLNSPVPPARVAPTGRRALPPELPRIEHRHEPDCCTCGQCGQTLVKIGEDM